MTPFGSEFVIQLRVPQQQIDVRRLTTATSAVVFSESTFARDESDFRMNEGSVCIFSSPDHLDILQAVDDPRKFSEVFEHLYQAVESTTKI